jgi:hypothetical protein
VTGLSHSNVFLSDNRSFSAAFMTRVRALLYAQMSFSNDSSIGVGFGPESAPLLRRDGNLVLHSTGRMSPQSLQGGSILKVTAVSIQCVTELGKDPRAEHVALLFASIGGKPLNLPLIRKTTPPAWSFLRKQESRIWTPDQSPGRRFGLPSVHRSFRTSIG